MIRSLHRWFALIASVFLITIAVSGAALSVYPLLDSLHSSSVSDLSVADLAAKAHDVQPSVSEIDRLPSGQIKMFYYEGSTPASGLFDPTTGALTAIARRPVLERWLIDLHRSLFLGDAGRWTAAASAVFMLVLCVSGLFMMARRAGGWRFMFSRPRGAGDGYVHTFFARFAVFGLLFSSLTALWMTAASFGFIPNDAGPPAFPTQVSGETGAAAAAIPALQQTSATALKSLIFPVPGDPTDVFTLNTDKGEGYIDQGTGDMLAWNDTGPWQKATAMLTMLHTGRGAALVGFILGLCALSVPLMSFTGVKLWLAGRRRLPRSVPASQADTIVLVGSEGGTTWTFATTLQQTLSTAGFKVHVGSLSTFQPQQWPEAKRVILLAATYGNGEEPASAKGFLDQLNGLDVPPKASLAILGFGDRSFPEFCGYANALSSAARAKGWTQFLPMDTVDRQSPQDFSRWGKDLAQALGLSFELNHQPALPKTNMLSLVSRRDYGADVQAPAAILRFALPRATLLQRLTGRGFPQFEPGDLVGIVPDGSTLPRFYSLASGRRDGFIEICVRRHNGGLCSSQLTVLEPGDHINAFIRRNPSFRPKRGKAPVVLIGAGTGIGPLAGFVRANHRRRPMHLYFGARHPHSDAFYTEELSDWQDQGRLSSIAHAFSRGARPIHVQDALYDDAAQLVRLVRSGAQILVCGGRDMADGVRDALADILGPYGLAPATLKEEGRYGEDVY